jgi:hypothetical protein
MNICLIKGFKEKVPREIPEHKTKEIRHNLIKRPSLDCMTISPTSAVREMSLTQRPIHDSIYPKYGKPLRDLIMIIIILSSL